MALIVQKFGGTSVGSIERIEAVADRIAKHHANGDQLIVVVSAMSGETNRLIGLAGEISDEPSSKRTRHVGFDRRASIDGITCHVAAKARG